MQTLKAQPRPLYEGDAAVATSVGNVCRNNTANQIISAERKEVHSFACAIITQRSCCRGGERVELTIVGGLKGDVCGRLDFRRLPCGVSETSQPCRCR
eukprot:scaffold66231_cov18-Prasinocladus_malaysianus.AAC.1